MESAAGSARGRDTLKPSPSRATDQAVTLVRVLAHTAAAVVFGSCGTSDEHLRSTQAQPAQATSRPSAAPPDQPAVDGANDVDGLSDDDDAEDESGGSTARADGPSDDPGATQPDRTVYGCLGQTPDDCLPAAEASERERQRRRRDSLAAEFLTCWRQCQQDPSCQRECNPVDSTAPGD